MPNQRKYIELFHCWDKNYLKLSPHPGIYSKQYGTVVFSLQQEKNINIDMEEVADKFTE